MMMMMMMMPRAVAHGGERGGRLVCGRGGVHVSTMQPALSVVPSVQRSGVVVAAPPPSCWCCRSCRVRDLLERQGHGVDDVHGPVPALGAERSSVTVAAAALMMVVTVHHAPRLRAHVGEMAPLAALSGGYVAVSARGSSSPQPSTASTMACSSLPRRWAARGGGASRCAVPCTACSARARAAHRLFCARARHAPLVLRARAPRRGVVAFLVQVLDVSLGPSQALQQTSGRPTEVGRRHRDTMAGA